MAYQTVFKRYEYKYLITAAQKEQILERMSAYMEMDDYGRSTIRNLYFDTDNYRLIRRSLEKPCYKEKLRLRSYAQVNAEDTVFAELKKKYRHVVYKRRLPLGEQTAMAWLCGGEPPRTDTQIEREIAYVLGYYGTLRPTVYLCYDREAFYEKNGGDFRVTFDDEIRCRTTDLSLTAAAGGIPLLDEGTVLMELKCSGGIPLWMTHALTDLQIRRTSFSKYGTAYRQLIFKEALFL